jgi:hypothetical protein
MRVSTADFVLVGAPFDSLEARNGGAVYAFDLLDPVGRVRTFRKSNPDAGDLFGASLAFLGTGNVLVGAPLDDTAGEDAGAVYLLNGVSGALIYTFVKPDAAPGDSFGSSVSDVGGYVLVGAPGDDTGAPDAGAVYLLDPRPTSPTFGRVLQKFPNPTPAARDQFGFSIVILDPVLPPLEPESIPDVIIGAPGDDRREAAATAFSKKPRSATTGTGRTATTATRTARARAAATAESRAGKVATTGISSTATAARRAAWWNRTSRAAASPRAA